MKQDRHAKIIQLVNQYEIETQEELAEKLKEAGFKVTQATVSRDIRELKLSKISAGGKMKYFAIQTNNGSMSEKYIGILREGFVSMDMAQNLLVIKTVAGMAMAVGAALDSMHLPEILGCIAGDDTIFCAVRTTEDTVNVMEKLRKMLK